MTSITPVSYKSMLMHSAVVLGETGTSPKEAAGALRKTLRSLTREWVDLSSTVTIPRAIFNRRCPKELPHSLRLVVVHKVSTQGGSEIGWRFLAVPLVEFDFIGKTVTPGPEPTMVEYTAGQTSNTIHLPAGSMEYTKGKWEHRYAINS